MAFHAQLLADTIKHPVTTELLAHVAHEASRVIPCHAAEDEADDTMPSLPAFINLLAKRSAVRAGTLLGALVFLDRLQQRLAPIAKGMPCTCHRIFLATLIVTSKALHDTSPKNKHWTRYAVYFKLPEVNLMEKQLLSLLNYRVIITLDDIYHVFAKYEMSLRKYRLPPLSALPNSSDHGTHRVPIVLPPPPPPPVYHTRPRLAPIAPFVKSTAGTAHHPYAPPHLAPLQSSSTVPFSSSLTSTSSLLSNTSSISSSSSSLSSTSSLADGPAAALPHSLATSSAVAATKAYYATSDKDRYPSAQLHSPSSSLLPWSDPLSQPFTLNRHDMDASATPQKVASSPSVPVIVTDRVDRQ